MTNIKSMKWLPIETAPKDGKPLLTARKGGGYPIIVRWSSETGNFEGCKQNFGASRLTHWMPLPEPPEEEK